MDGLKIDTRQIRLLEKLCNALSVSGDETEVRRIVRSELENFVDEIRVDALGNLLAIQHAGSSRALRVLLAAHMDEVGLMIVGGEGPGIFRFDKIGGIKVNELVGKQVIVGKEHKPAVIGCRPIHLQTPDDYKKVIELDSLRIDLGKYESIKIGERAAFATKFQRAGPSIMAKSIDNRIGVAILIELIKNAPENLEVCAAFTVQEEIGARGAAVAAHYFKPDAAFVIDATPAYDFPAHDQVENLKYNTQLGKGPAIYVADKSTIYHPGLFQAMIKTTKDNKIPYQIRQPAGGGTDAAAIQNSLAGIPTLAVSVPHRYPHSPVSVARLADWKIALNLLHTALRNISPAAIR